jgi:hypothetical protein
MRRGFAVSGLVGLRFDTAWGVECVVSVGCCQVEVCLL